MGARPNKLALLLLEANNREVCKLTVMVSCHVMFTFILLKTLGVSR